MKKLISVGSLAVAALALSACATVTRGTKETFRVQTTPEGAEVAMSNGQTCVSPCALKLKRKDEFTVTVKKAGYKDATAEIRSVVKGGGVAGVAGNVLVGGIIGAAVDGSNGSMRDLTPNPLVIVLEPLAAIAPAAVAVEPAAVPAPADAPTAGGPAAPAGETPGQ